MLVPVLHHTEGQPSFLLPPEAGRPTLSRCTDFNRTAGWIKVQSDECLPRTGGTSIVVITSLQFNKNVVHTSTGARCLLGQLGVLGCLHHGDSPPPTLAALRRTSGDRLNAARASEHAERSAQTNPAPTAPGPRSVRAAHHSRVRTSPRAPATTATTVGLGSGPHETLHPSTYPATVSTYGISF